ncbi:inositol monophosphatase family protein [Kribbella pittospori]|uniref:Inositol monophosphatase family protein n=1 Tax=Kribbella pittospori TaxID=722689 RepID=A0A4R0KN58_9ACTN|nr:inositol monophosphatase family protein [Kribbella pittospori]TCC59558.1 inositol monophosphatase family protein [Kribbella pittospori]
MDLAELLKVAEAAVDRGRVVTDSRAPGVLTSKGDRDMASEVDFAVEREVRAFLERETPEIGVLGEEEGGATDGTRWVLDPIDGTVNFIHGVPLWGISLGLIHEGRAVAGVIDHPALGTRYAAAEGHGATCNGKPIGGSECADLSEALVAVGDYGVGPDADRVNAERLALTQLLYPRAQRIRMIGTAATALTWTAAGHFDATIMFSNKPWDTMAGVSICREAGVTVLDLDGSQHAPESRGTFAVSAALADPLLELIAQTAVH